MMKLSECLNEVPPTPRLKKPGRVSPDAPRKTPGLEAKVAGRLRGAAAESLPSTELRGGAEEVHAGRLACVR